MESANGLEMGRLEQSVFTPSYCLITNYYERPHGGYGVAFPPNPNTEAQLATEINLKAKVNADGTWDSSFTISRIADNPFCGGHSQMVDGSYLFVGGDSSLWPLMDGTVIQPDGHYARRIYAPCVGQNCQGNWQIQTPMTTPRWYPTVATLHTGSQIIAGGVTTYIDIGSPINNNNPTYEYYPSKTGNWPRNLELLSWYFPFCLYPLVLQMPSGDVMMTASNKSIVINPVTDQITFPIPDLIAPDHMPWIYPYTPTYTILPMTIKNNYRFVVQYCGGTSAAKESVAPASEQCWQIAPLEKNPTWTRIDNMPHKRVMIDSVILPAGGYAGEVKYARDPLLEPDLFDPAAPPGKQWQTMAKSQIYRLYHSEAILVQSGHVVLTGSEQLNYDDYWKNGRQDCYPNAMTPCTDPYNYDMERFEPPYFELAEKHGRLQIASAPTALSYNEVFTIQVAPGTGSKVRRVTFTRYSSVTHSTNTDQRFVELRILEVKGDSVSVRAPWSRAMAVPGNWMLWVLDDKGIPSESATVLMKNDGTGTDFSLTDPNPVTDDFYAAFSSAWVSSKLAWALGLFGVFVI